jgi:hypothetical protein
MRRLCGAGYLEELIAGDAKLQELVSLWQGHASGVRKVDTTAGEAAVARIYARLNIPSPEIRWWPSPIAMILAHETVAHGMRWVERRYGNAVVQSSPEYIRWLDSADKGHALGKSLGERSCNCGGSRDRRLMLDCLQHDFMRKVRLSFTQRAVMDLVPMTYQHQFRGAQVRQAIELALNGLLEPDSKVFQYWAFQRRSLAGLSESCIFWAQERCEDFLRVDMEEHIADGSERETCLHAYRDLAKYCHVALLREGLCWLCVDPLLMRFNDDGELHDDAGAALYYRDGTQLFCVDGMILPEEAFLQPHSLSMDYIDGPDSMPIRREALLSRYGVKRYLKALQAELLDEFEESKLWRVTLSNQDAVVIPPLLGKV